MVWVGLGLYGFYFVFYLGDCLDLKFVLIVWVKIIQIRIIFFGIGVSYGY